MKNIFIKLAKIAVVFFGILNTGCEDFLDINSSTATDDTIVLSNTSNLDKILVGTYNGLLMGNTVYASDRGLAGLTGMMHYYPQQEQSLIVWSPCRCFSEFGRNGCRDCAQRFENGSGNHGGISGHHQNRHRLADSASDTQHHPRGNARDRIRDHYFINGLPLRSSECQAGFTHGTGTVAHGVFSHRYDGGQCHDGKHNASRKSALPHRQIKYFLNQRYNHDQAEKAIYHRRNTAQQLYHRLQPTTYFRIGHL